MDADILEYIKASMIKVKGGTFQMGDLLKMYHPFLNINKIGTTLVELSDFHICDHPVTNAEWARVMGISVKNEDLNRPVVNISWHQCHEFIQKLNKLTNWNFRLPTEAEWEYAARGGELSDGAVFSGKNVLDMVGWYNMNSSNRFHSVKQKDPNQLGLYDMSGNVWEWCQDVYQKSYEKGPRKGLFSLERHPVKNPIGAIVGENRVIRGGAFNCKDTLCWVFYREKFKSSNSRADIGFRIAY